MTIERPMFPPAADNVVSFSVQPAPEHRPNETPLSDSPEPTGANVVPLRRKPEETVSGDPQEPRARSNTERSVIIALSVEYVSELAAFNAGFGADHGGDCDYANGALGAGRNYFERSQRALKRLRSAANDLRTQPHSRQEMWSMTTAARRMLESASRDGFDLNPVEAGFLKTFVVDLEFYFGLNDGGRS